MLRIEQLFGVKLSTVCVAVYQVCQCIVVQLMLIIYATGDLLKAVRDGFFSNGDCHNVWGQLTVPIFPLLPNWPSRIGYMVRLG